MRRTWTIVVVIAVAFLGGCDGLLVDWSDDDDEALAAEDYFPTAPGYGVKYHVSDDHASRDYDGSVWTVLQSIDVAPALNRDYALVQSYVDVQGGTGRYRNSLLAGALRTPPDGNTYFLLGAGLPVGNQVHYPRFLSTLPETFEDGDTYSMDMSSYGAVEFTVEAVGEHTVGSHAFSDCVKVSADVPNPDDVYFEGSGWAVLAPGTGIVELSFTRVDGTTNSYEYEASESFAAHTISGTVTTDGTTPADGYVVGIATVDVTSWTVTDSNGNYSITAYGPSVQFYIGLDGDGDDTIDRDNPESGYPKEFTVRNVTSDLSNVNIDLSTL